MYLPLTNFHKTTKNSHSEFVNKLWATTAIGLGVWESAAVTTKKVPTITATCRAARQRHRRQTEVVIITWLFGLGWHLLQQKSDH